MRSGRVLIAAVLFLIGGLWVLFAFCHGTAGFNVSTDTAGNNVSLNMITTGIPMLIGMPLALIGLFLLLIAFLGAIVMQFRKPPEIRQEQERSRREIPFEE